MIDKSSLNSQPHNISDALQNFIDSMVEEIVLEGKPFETQKKYLKKFSENEGLDYEALENNLNDFFDVMAEWRDMHMKSSELMAKMIAKECYISSQTLKTLLANDTVRSSSNSANNANMISSSLEKDDTLVKKSEDSPSPAIRKYGRKSSSGVQVESDDIFDNMPGGDNLKE